jgi:hypothetical protein
VESQNKECIGFWRKFWVIRDDYKNRGFTMLSI